MRIKRLEMKNFRGFEELAIDFPEGEAGLAVFVGVNGAGKTSVLDALGKLINTIIAASQKQESKDFLLQEDDMKIGSPKTEIRFEFEVNGNIESINMDIAANGAQGKTSSPLRLSQVTEETIIPLLAYYKTNREPVQNDIEEEGNGWNGRFFAYNNAFVKIVDDFKDLSKWFRYEEDLEQQEIIDREDFNYVNQNLQIVREAISKSLKSFDVQFNKLRVRRKKAAKFDFREPSKEWSLAISKKDLELKLAQLSSGERTLISLVADISRRATIANPQMPNPLICEGVILIDEIELHLHPEWQRNVIPALRNTFPNLQFILTTHSPQVLSNVKRENVFVLEDFKLVNTPFTYGRDSNSILWDLFGVESRPDEAQRDFKKLYRLIDDLDKKEEAETFLDNLEAKYGADDPELVRAGMHLRFLTT